MSSDRVLPRDLTGARLGCGCRVIFRPGVEGSPVAVVLSEKSATCTMPIHVAAMPIYDHREALRPATRPLPAAVSDHEEEG